MRTAGPEARSDWWVLVPLLLGTFTGTVANNVVNVPMAAILSGLDVPLARGAFVVVGFTLTFAVLMPLAGWLGDRFGRRRVYSGALVGLSVGAVGAALAPDLRTLVAFRALQGLATACVLPTVMSMIASTFDQERRGRALGFWAGVNGAGQAVGPALGGFVAEWLGWRAVFWPTVPLALSALVATLWLVPRDVGRPLRLEWRGAVLLTLGAGLFLGAGSAVPPLGIASPVVWLSAVAGVLSMAAYVVVERGRARAFLPPGLLLEARYLRSSFAVVVQMFALGATLLAIPLHLTVDEGRTTAEAGLVVLSLPVAMAVLAPLAGLTSERLGPRTALRGGLAVLTGGMALLAFVLETGRSSDGVLVGALAVVGAGIAFVQTPAATGATRSRAGRLGAGLGLFNLLRFGGSALGAAWVAGVATPGPPGGLVFGVCACVAAGGLLVAFAGGEPDQPIVRLGARRQAEAVAVWR